jgi:hypothetical protein
MEERSPNVRLSDGCRIGSSFRRVGSSNPPAVAESFSVRNRADFEGRINASL